MKNTQLFFSQNIKRIFISFFLLIFCAQIIFQLKTEHIKPDIHAVPPLPTKLKINILSLGDNEFYFRVLALKIQNAGDTFGRFVPLKDYNYEKLYKWFKLLDSLNDQSRIIPSIASYYYSQTQTPRDTIYLIKYLDEFASRDIDKHWWWMYQATYMAKMVLRDMDLALELAYKLSQNQDEDAPLWTKQLPAFFHARAGNDCESFFIINSILKDHDSGTRELKAEELNFMKHFIRERLAVFSKKKFNPNKCPKI